ncbi:MAG: hypothetical protein COT73_06065 [Bdellovibrio sp. CG10_big_fil_rev_8_21_14_0_10_47_8]|nr:MAG: hypothetical protein COT73_06065 [Bdellovibrio sp. CG10_big_fil_rev_8_21_14_0_10_47_8]
MSLYVRVIQQADLDEILQFEGNKLKETVSDEMERNFLSWNSRWRKESLEHYLSMGWSFLARDESQTSSHSEEGLLAGYFIAQPLLFFDGHTQSLWIEHMQFSTLQARDELCDLAYKLCREKHLQKVFFPESQTIANAVRSLKAQNWDPQVLSISTTRTSS